MLCLIQWGSVKAQIVNIESQRKVSDTSKWSGNFNVGFQVIQNKNFILMFNVKAHVQYNAKKHFFLTVGGFDFKSSNQKKLVDKGILHFRYNYKIKPFFAWEVFSQGQFNLLSHIEYRFLGGTGARFKLFKNDNYKFYLGTSVMFESEHLRGDSQNDFNETVRSSSYFSFGIYPNKTFSLVSTTYFQPRLEQLSDFRISTDVVLSLKIFKNLSFTSNFSLWNDQTPAVGVRKTQYKWVNGLSYSFD